jgi:ATP-dependent Lon protease
MSASSKRSEGHYSFSSSGGDDSPASAVGEGAVVEGEVEAAARAGFGNQLVPKASARGLAQRHPVPYHLAEALLARFKREGHPEKEATRKAGRALGDRLARAEDVELIKTQASRSGSAEVIDHVEATFDAGRAEPVARLSRLGLSKIPLGGGLAEDHDRLLKGGFYADVQLKYGGQGGGPPFKIGGLEPLRASAAEPLGQIWEGRPAFSDAAWLCFLARSIGLAAPSEALGPRPLALALLRLVPLAQENYCLLELGPRQTGKTFVYEELSPRAHVLSSGTASPAQLIVDTRTEEPGLLATSDVVCFDEVTTATGLEEIASALKGYLSSGAARRGREEIQGRASVVMIGNIDRPVEEILKEETLGEEIPEEETLGDGHLFEPLPEALGEDTAFMDRVSAFLPGWEVPKLGREHLTSGPALPSATLAEALAQLRRQDYISALKPRLELTGNLTERDRAAAWKTIGGLVKLIYPSPDGLSEMAEVPDGVLRWAAWLGLEMRLRVRAQQRWLQPGEFSEGNFGFRVGGDGKTAAASLPEIS